MWRVTVLLLCVLVMCVTRHRQWTRLELAHRTVPISFVVEWRYRTAAVLEIIVLRVLFQLEIRRTMIVRWWWGLMVVITLKR